jgi:uncharacterized protein DUF3455
MENAMHPSTRLPLAVLLFASAIAGAALAQLPAPVDAPGETPVLTLRAAGAQIYECKAGTDGKLAWAFREPVATLTLDGNTIGRHYRGPTFEHIDGSAVVIKPVASAPSPDGKSIPWLKAEVVDKRGTGALSGAATVQRINTQGGTLQGPCEQAGALQGAAYNADYVFLRKQPEPPR